MSKSRVTFQDEDQRSESTVLVYHDVRLKQSDVATLKGPFWLTDQIIAFFFQYLESNKFARYQKHFSFISPQVTQLVKMSSKEDCRVFLEPLQADQKNVVFFAVNNNNSSNAGGTHWSLLVFSRFEGTFFSLDSSNNLNSSATKKTVQVLKTGLRCPLAAFEIHECTQQTNSEDCGIHVLANVENICEHFLTEGFVRRTPVQRMSAFINKRQEILNLIEGLGGKV